MREWATAPPAESRLRLFPFALSVSKGLFPGTRSSRSPRTLALAALVVFLAAATAAGVFLFARQSAHSEAQATQRGRERWLAGDRSRLPAVAAVSGVPQAGAIFACPAPLNGGGAFATGPWLRPDGTFDLTAKPTVDGAVQWTGRFTITLDGATRAFAGNGLPFHPTGVFPIARTDDAYAFDRNPNSIRAIPVTRVVPAQPALAEAPACLPMGPIGILRTGAVLFNALDAAGRDAVAHEIQDACFGHPGPMGSYHYHSLTPCLADARVHETPETHSPLVGYALDGFGIFGPRGEGGALLQTSDLDECHGHTHAVEWDGKRLSLYHYHATWSYPYTLGCFRGAVTPPAS
ncbi:MAG TPA: YHYH protein [Chloroflexota bacterium]|nr:YHYH protein [Chloroflexota bacterium]